MGPLAACWQHPACRQRWPRACRLIPTRPTSASTSPSMASPSPHTSGPARSRSQSSIRSSPRTASCHSRLSIRAARRRAHRSSPPCRTLVQLRQRQRFRFLEQLRRYPRSKPPQNGNHSSGANRLHQERAQARRIDRRFSLDHRRRSEHPCSKQPATSSRKREKSGRSTRSSPCTPWTRSSFTMTRKACWACA